MQDSFVGNGDMKIEVYGEGMESGKVRNRGVGGVAREVIVKCGFGISICDGKWGFVDSESALLEIERSQVGF